MLQSVATDVEALCQSGCQLNPRLAHTLLRMPYACLILIGKSWDGSQRNSCCAQQCLRKQVKEWRQLQTAGSELASRAMRGRAVGSGGALPAAARWRCGYTARLSSISQPLQTCEQRWRAEGLATNGCRVPSTLRMVGAGPQQAAMAISTRDQAQVLNRKTAGGSQQHSTGTAPAAGVTAQTSSAHTLLGRQRRPQLCCFSPHAFCNMHASRAQSVRATIRWQCHETVTRLCRRYAALACTGAVLA